MTKLKPKHEKSSVFHRHFSTLMCSKIKLFIIIHDLNYTLLFITVLSNNKEYNHACTMVSIVFHSDTSSKHTVTNYIYNNNYKYTDA